MNEKEFERFYQHLVEKITKEETEQYSPNVLDEYHHPKNFGTIHHPTATGTVKGPCGDTMSIQISVKENIICQEAFFTDCCGASIACGSMLTQLIHNQTIAHAQQITSKNLLLSLGGLPKEHIHCTKLAISTLHRCLEHLKEKPGSHK